MVIAFLVALGVFLIWGPRYPVGEEGSGGWSTFEVRCVGYYYEILIFDGAAEQDNQDEIMAFLDLIY